MPHHPKADDVEDDESVCDRKVVNVEYVVLPRWANGGGMKRTGRFESTQVGFSFFGDPKTMGKRFVAERGSGVSMLNVYQFVRDCNRPQLRRRQPVLSKDNRLGETPFSRNAVMCEHYRSRAGIKSRG